MKKQAIIHQYRYPKILLILWALLLLGGCALQDESGKPDESACDRPYVSVSGKIVYTENAHNSIHLLENRIFTEIEPREEHFLRSGPRWSPDGKYIAYILYCKEDPWDSLNSDNKRSISIIHPDGTPYRELFIEGTCPHFSDNGFADIAWSQLGSQIAYLQPEEEGFSVRIANIAQEDEKTVATLEGFPLAFDWSPDGRYFVISRRGSPGIIEVNQSGNLTREMKVSKETTFLRYSPDGKKIMYIQRYTDHDLQIMDADFSDQHVVSQNCISGAWSPDGTRIVCLKRVRTEFGGFLTDDQYCYYLCTKDLNGNERLKISPQLDFFSVRDLDWTGT